MLTREFFTCDCESLEHQIVFTKWTDDEHPEDNCLILEVHLNPTFGIWRRIKEAFKYIFGFRSSYGDFDEFIFKTKDADRLQEVVDFLRTLKEVK